MKNRDFVLANLFLVASFLLLVVGTGLAKGVALGAMASLGFVSMIFAMYFWCKFALPYYVGHNSKHA